MVQDTEYYDLLGISPSAGSEEIKKAYKQKARQHHPDKNPDDASAHETFQKIAQAYETLSNPDDRAWYDQNGSSARPGPSSGPSGPDLDALFAQMFGGGGAYASFDPHAQHRGPRRGRDFDIIKEISLEDAFLGKTIHVKLARDKLCGQCKGTGGKKGGVKVKCGRCSGKGKVFEDRALGPGLIGKAAVTCPSCHGEKEQYSPSHRCSKCKGTCVTKSSKTVEVVIEPGTAHGERIKLAGQADEAPNTITGDVIFHIHILPHPLFTPSPTANSSDLLIALSISLSEALLGFDRIMFTHLDGRGIRLISPKGQRVIRHGDELVVMGEGMPKRSAGSGGWFGFGSGRGDKKGERGNLRVKFGVEMPDPSWALRADGTTVRLPPAPPNIYPVPPLIESRYLVERAL